MTPNKYIDLHFHFDGAISTKIAIELAKITNVEIPSDIEKLRKLLRVDKDCRSLDDFLSCFDLALKLLQSKQAITYAVKEILQKANRHGIIYAEIRFAPQLHQKEGLTQEDAILAVLEGMKQSGVKSNLILCCLRGDDNHDENVKTIELAKKYLVKDGGVVAIDLAGSEAMYHTGHFKDLFALANKYNIPFTIHAGEADGPESLKRAIAYGAKRIGHGIRIREDIELMKLAKEKGIFFEMCPSSSLLTCTVKDINDFPLLDYLDYGLKVTINTDDPGIIYTSIEKEFELLRDKLNLTEKQEKEIINNSIDGAFTTDEVKAWLRKEIFG